MRRQPAEERAGCARASCRSRSPGSITMRSRATPAASSARGALAQEGGHFGRPRRRSAGSACMRRGRALHVHHARGDAARRRPPRPRLGARNAFTSFTIAQPGVDRRAHHFGLHRVHRDRRRPRATSALDHRDHARAAPRRAQPAARPGASTRRRRRPGRRPPRAGAGPCSIARAASRKRPPSEKESAVTLTMPITSGRSQSETGRPQATPLRDCRRPRAQALSAGAGVGAPAPLAAAVAAAAWRAWRRPASADAAACPP